MTIRMGLRCRPVREAWLLFPVFLVSACGGDDCKSALDCRSDEVCVDGRCEKKGGSGDTGTGTSDTDTGEDRDSESASDTWGGGDTLTDSDSHVDTEGTDSHTGHGGDTASETESEIPGGALADGQPCGGDGDCRSDHCDNGICCREGTCCGTPGNSASCPAAPCRTVFCDGNFVCRFYDRPCGAIDMGESPCDGDRRCDGAGACRAVLGCDAGAFRGTGDYVCSGTDVSEICALECGNDEHCNAGHRCVGDDCVGGLGIGDRGCDRDADCAAGLCDPNTRVCCATGICCVESTDCGRYACDDASAECATTCLDSNGLDDDGACAGTTFHCDNGWCYPDMANGEEWCDENSDCASEHCDPDSGICCAGGRCCVDDSDCSGYACVVGSGNYCHESCAVGGVDDDTLCAEGFLCRDGRCVGPLLDNGDACTRGPECRSAHCGNGFCCDEGECCGTAADCESDLLCNTATCSGNHQCMYYPLPCNAIDFDEGDICLGLEQCDGYGNCLPTPGCGDGYLPTAILCGEGVLTPVCPTFCGSDADCEASHHCSGVECVPDFALGEGPCDSNMECESGYCNAITAVCCESGYCCDDDAQCASFGLICDEATASCLTMCTDHEDCAGFGDFHCIGNVCEADIPNGDSFCMEDAMCLSEYCDLATGICCAGGDCCIDDGDCGGFSCGATHSCVADCGGDDGLCAPGYYCNGSSCEARVADGDDCAAHSDCASGHCDATLGICCEGPGPCCRSGADCDDGDPCTNEYCSVGFKCYTIQKADGESCSDGLFCNGVERCTGGVCAAASAPCTGASACLVEACDEEADRCTQHPRNEGQACSEVEFCIGNVQRVCNATGLCVDPGTGTPPCTQETANPCTAMQCDELADACVETSLPDGAPCDDDPCNGDNLCEDGSCVASGSLPCDDNDPCTIDTCTNDNGTAVCGTHVPKADGEPCDDAPCRGEGATCWSGVCIDGDSPCSDGQVCTLDSCYMYVSGMVCLAEESPWVELRCGQTVTLTDEDFLTREVSGYGAECPGDHPGLEAVVTVVMDAAGSVTVSASNAAPDMPLAILLLDDWCDSETCSAMGEGAVTATLAEGANTFVIEAPLGPPPTSVDISAACN